MKRPFLDAYRKFAAAGRLPKDGLCSCLPEEAILSEVWKFIEPDAKEGNALCREGLSLYHWASGVSPIDKDKYRAFTPLRANILLLCACVNGEY